MQGLQGAPARLVYKVVCVQTRAPLRQGLSAICACVLLLYGVLFSFLCSRLFPMATAPAIAFNADALEVL